MPPWTERFAGWFWGWDGLALLEDLGGVFVLLAETGEFGFEVLDDGFVFWVVVDVVEFVGIGMEIEEFFVAVVGVVVDEFVAVGSYAAMGGDAVGG